MNTLLKALEKLYTNRGVVKLGGGKVGFCKTELYKKVVDLCEEHLFIKGGYCNWTNIRTLHENGYRVFAGKKDSFGWLTGCVQKNNDKRIIIYG